MYAIYVSRVMVSSWVMNIGVASRYKENNGRPDRQTDRQKEKQGLERDRDETKII
jgi:hypothetical protein